MYNVTQALFGFFGGFGLPVYAEGDAPTEKEQPYITVQLTDPEWTETAGFYARVWYRSPRYDAVIAKVDEIKTAIGDGVAVPCERGTVWLYRDTPFAQFMPTGGDPYYKCMYLRLKMQALTDR